MATDSVDTSVDSTPEPKPRKKAAPRKRAAAANPDETITLTRAQLDELLSRVTGTNVAASAPVNNSDFLGAVREIIQASKPPERITVDNRVAFNPMNPTNEKRKLAKPFFQNFERVDEEDLTPLEYQLIPQLKPGLFIKSRRGIALVEVIFVKRGDKRGVHIRYDNSKADKAIELQTYAPTLEVMLQKCISEYAAQQQLILKRRAAGLPDQEDDE
jgi:hypothetical protein